MSRYFPLFVDLTGKAILVYGAGTIASRRIASLLPFEPRLTVVAPRASDEIQRLAKEGRLIWRKEVYRPGEAKAYFFVLAATDSPAVNDAVWEECRKAGIPVNVSSDREKCDFYFPGLAVKEQVVVGVTAGGTDHWLAREITERIRKEVL